MHGTKKNYTIYFSGNEQLKNGKGEILRNTNAGVGFIINNELKNYIEDIEPINDRIMTIPFVGTLPVTFICNYSPTAQATTDEKIAHYKLLRETQEKHQSKGPTYTLGDFNARIQKKCKKQKHQ